MPLAYCLPSPVNLDAFELISQPQYFRFCRQCLQEDEEKYGEFYWHRIHELSCVLVCPTHNIPLQNSTLLFQQLNQHHYQVASHNNCISEGSIAPSQTRSHFLSNSIAPPKLDHTSHQNLDRTLSQNHDRPSQTMIAFQNERLEFRMKNQINNDRLSQRTIALPTSTKNDRPSKKPITSYQIFAQFIHTKEIRSSPFSRIKL